MCSPVDQATPDTAKEDLLRRGDSSSVIMNGDRKREFSPAPAPPPMRSRSSPALQVPRSVFEREPSKLAMENQTEKSAESKGEDFGIAIKQLEFESANDTYCAMSEASPLKVTVPTQSSVLLTGVPDSVQLLIHSREGPPLTSESLQSRIFHSQHEMDVAVVTAMLSARNSFKNNSDGKKDNLTTLQDKHKPMKKRSLTDLNAGATKDEYEIHPPPKRYFSSGYIEYNPKLSQELAEHRPTSIYHVPVATKPSLYEQTLTSFNVLPTRTIAPTIPVLSNLSVVNPQLVGVRMAHVQPLSKIAIKSEPLEPE